jgi:hypothetical protein
MALRITLSEGVSLGVSKHRSDDQQDDGNPAREPFY